MAEPAAGAAEPAAAGGFAEDCSAGRCKPGALQLLHEHVRKAEPAAARDVYRQLIIEHALVEVLLIAAQNLVAEIGVAHALDHHARENRLELARRLAQRLRILVLSPAFERIQPREVGIGFDVGDGRGHMTMSSARRAPASFKASRIATRSPGAAPT